MKTRNKVLAGMALVAAGAGVFCGVNQRKAQDLPYFIAESYYSGTNTPITREEAARNGLDYEKLSDPLPDFPENTRGLVHFAYVIDFQREDLSADRTIDCLVLYRPKDEKSIERPRDLQGLMNSEDTELRYFVREGFLEEVARSKELRRLVDETKVIPNDKKRITILSKTQYESLTSGQYQQLEFSNLK